MTGYLRQDVTNNIANGNVIDADDLDDEFNAIEAAFNATSGHTHDGTVAGGAAITKVGPAQDVIIGTTNILPKANNILDVGSAAAKFKDGYFDGTVYIDTAIVGVNGYTEIEDNLYSVSSGNLLVDVAGDITLDADGGNVHLHDGGIPFGGFTNSAGDLVVKSGTTTAATFNGADVDFAGNLDVTGDTTLDGTLNVVGNTAISSGNFTVNTGNATVGGSLNVTGPINGNLVGTVTGNVTGNLTGNVTGNVTGNTTGNVTGDLTGDVKALNGVTVLDNGTNGTDATFVGDVTGDLVGNVTGNLTGNVTSTGANLMNTLTTSGTVTVGGDLIVNGTTTTVNTNTINLADNIITLNSDETGTPSQSAGIEIERGTAINKSLTWDEVNDRWTVGTENFVASTFIGNVSGNVSGNITGNVAGNVTGDVTGDIRASNGTVVLNNGTNGTDATFTGSVSGNASSASIASQVTINYSDNSSGTYQMLWGSGNQVYGTSNIYCNPYTDFLYASSFEAGNWFRSTGQTGWYSSTYGGGIYMEDSTWVRTYNGKSFYSTGSILAAGDVTAYSDERLKSDIVTIPDALEKVKALRGVNFTKDGEASTGVIAQEVQKVIPEVVQENGEYLSVAYGNLVGVLIEAVKELSAEVESLKKAK